MTLLEYGVSDEVRSSIIGSFFHVLRWRSLILATIIAFVIPPPAPELYLINPLVRPVTTNLKMDALTAYYLVYGGNALLTLLFFLQLFFSSAAEVSERSRKRSQRNRAERKQHALDSSKLC